VKTAEPVAVLPDRVVHGQLLLCLKLDEHIVEPVQSGVPGGLEAADPLVDGLQRGPIDPVPATPAITSD